MTRTVKTPENRKQEIISAARDLFLKNEYEKTSMQDIITQLGIAKGTIYHYFNSKEELLDAVVENTVAEYIEKLKGVLDKTQGNALDRMRILIAAGNVTDEQSKTLEQLHRPGNVALHTRQLAVTFAKMAPLIAKVIEEGCKEGVFKTEHPLESAELLLSGIQFLIDVGVYPWKEEDLLRRSKAIPSLVEAQLNAPKGSFGFLLK